MITSARVMTIFFSAFILLFMFVFSLYYFQKSAYELINQSIAEDIAQLQGFFKEIDASAGIASFAHERNFIDFLNVRSFEGAEIGSMRLLAPELWKGPYVQDNLAIQGKVYEIARTADGYYIMPGIGVKLSDGRQIGSDIIITCSTNITELLQSDTGLRIVGSKSIFAKIPVRYGEPHACLLPDTIK